MINSVFEIASIDVGWSYKILCMDSTSYGSFGENRV